MTPMRYVVLVLGVIVRYALSRNARKRTQLPIDFPSLYFQFLSRRIWPGNIFVQNCRFTAQRLWAAVRDSIRRIFPQQHNPTI